MNWTHLGYALACVVAPVLWGVGVARATTWLERVLRERHSRNRPATATLQDLPPIDYHI